MRNRCTVFVGACGRMLRPPKVVIVWDLMVIWWDLMGFNGDLMGFNGALMGINCDLMEFLAKCVNTTPTTVLLMIYRTSCWGQQTYLVGQHLIRLKLWSSNMKLDNNPIAGDCPIKYADCSLPSAQIKTGCLDYSGVRVGGLLTTPWGAVVMGFPLTFW